MFLRSGNRTNSSFRSLSFIKFDAQFDQIEKFQSFVNMYEQKVNSEL